MRIFFTGGSGKAGRHAIEHLADQGHEVTNADLVPARLDGVPDLRVDLTDAGQVFDALSSYARFDELEPGTGVPRYDAVVHFAAIPAILVRPDNETFRVNALSTYNVIDAAIRLGIRKVVFASSETTYGICFADGEVLPQYVPIDEEHPTVPHDSYAMSKVVNEVTARSFQARSGIDIYGLRINNVIEPHEYATKFPAFIADPSLRRRNIFAYIDARDLGHMVDRCLHTDGLGYEVFNVSNDDTSVGITSAEVCEHFYAGVEQRRPLGAYETFYANDKAKRLVGFAPRHSWRQALAQGVDSAGSRINPASTEPTPPSS
jgi:nucleoside-diphosphate-sugar epimerase